ncbi:hypothetical protein HK102_013980, partial [Quaeritorhiza haematococci]
MDLSFETIENSTKSSSGNGTGDRFLSTALRSTEHRNAPANPSTSASASKGRRPFTSIENASWIHDSNSFGSPLSSFSSSSKGRATTTSKSVFLDDDTFGAPSALLSTSRTPDKSVYGKQKLGGSSSALRETPHNRVGGGGKSRFDGVGGTTSTRKHIPTSASGFKRTSNNHSETLLDSHLLSTSNASTKQSWASPMPMFDSYSSLNSGSSKHLHSSLFSSPGPGLLGGFGSSRSRGLQLGGSVALDLDMDLDMDFSPLGSKTKRNNQGLGVGSKRLVGSDLRSPSGGVSGLMSSVGLLDLDELEGGGDDFLGKLEDPLPGFGSGFEATSLESNEEGGVRTDFMALLTEKNPDEEVLGFGSFGDVFITEEDLKKAREKLDEEDVVTNEERVMALLRDLREKWTSSQDLEQILINEADAERPDDAGAGLPSLVGEGISLCSNFVILGIGRLTVYSTNLYWHGTLLNTHALDAPNNNNPKETNDEQQQRHDQIEHTETTLLGFPYDQLSDVRAKQVSEDEGDRTLLLMTVSENQFLQFSFPPSENLAKVEEFVSSIRALIPKKTRDTTTESESDGTQAQTNQPHPVATGGDCEGNGEAVGWGLTVKKPKSAAEEEEEEDDDDKDDADFEESINALMQKFDSLKVAAKEKRDRLIREAEEEYAKELGRLDEECSALRDKMELEAKEKRRLRLESKQRRKALAEEEEALNKAQKPDPPTVPQTCQICCDEFESVVLRPCGHRLCRACAHRIRELASSTSTSTSTTSTTTSTPQSQPASSTSSSDPTTPASAKIEKKNLLPLCPWDRKEVEVFDMMELGMFPGVA